MSEPTENQKFDIRKNIDWFYESAGNKPPTRFAQYFAPVVIGPDGNFPSIRGYLGAVSCANYGIIYGMLQNKRASVIWFSAAQGHRPDIAATFQDFPDFTVEYAISKWKHKALEAAALGSLYDQITAIQGWLIGKTSDHNPSHNPSDLEDWTPPRPTPATPISGGERPGGGPRN